MKLLAPIDGSDCSFRALELAVEFARQYNATLHVVHFVDQDADRDREDTQNLISRAEAVLDDAGVETAPEVVTDVWITDYRYANRIGKDILDLATEEGYDHVVMGHHGTGVIGRAILGSAAETVARAATVPVTIVP
ncbi:MAG: universal stress protein [Halobacteriales archaeon]|nr:universal stress protein [Halobacteriales archaeon]